MSAVKPPKPPVGLAATAWVAPTVQYLNDTAGTVFTFSIRNTGTIGIGAVEVARPSSSWVVTACPLAPAGWSTQRSDNFCRYRSASGTADDLAPGSLTSSFQLRATTAAGTADRTGTWSIHVSSSGSFDDPSALKPAPPEPPGLTITAFSFQITDAQVGTGTSGAVCPAPTAANHSAITGSTQTILICGRNRMSAAATPTAARSSLAGTFIASPGTFSSDSIPANSANVILGKWTGATITSTSGPGKSIITKTGSAVNRNSPLTTLDDVCGASPAFETCIANGGYEALNEPPDAVDDTANANEDGPAVPIDVLANDSDPDGDPITVTSTGGSPQGLVTIDAGGTGVTYNPNGQFESLAAGETDTDTFTYTIQDPFLASDTATVTVTITGQNDPPTAGDDVATVAEDSTGTTISVLANDTDPDATDTLAVTAVDTTGTTGSVTNNGTDVTYDPNGQFDGLAAGETAIDTFTYTASDGNGGTDTATVTVTITGANDPPVANNDLAAANEDGPAILVNVLANDTDPDADTLAINSIDTTGTVGSVTNNGTDVTYNPNGQFESLGAGETANDTFTYTVADGHGGTDTATVTVTITGVNDPPTAGDDTATVGENSTGDTILVLANDTDPDGDTLAVTAVDTTGTIGSVTNNATDVTYDPNGQFDGLGAGETATDTFTYTISDGNGGTDTATVTVTITGANDSPVANDDLGSTDEDTQLNVAAPGVLANDTDPDGDTLTPTEMNGSAAAIGVATAISSGAIVTLNANGSYSYNPNGAFDALAAGESDTDSFSYTISDGNGGTDSATVTITIYGVNDPPTAVDDTASTPEYADVVVDVLANDTDPDSSDTLSITSVDTTGTLGSVTNNGTDVTYDPNGQFDALNDGESGTDTFTYTISDGNGGTDTATVTVTINGSTNQPPTAVDDTANVGEDSTGDTIDVLANDTDPNSDPLNVTAVDTTGTIGSVTNNGTDVTYDPNGKFESLGVGDSDTDTFTYTVSDGNGGTDTATVTVTITGANDPPVANDDVASTDEDTTVSVAAPGVLANDTDPDGDTLSSTEMNGSPAAIGVATAIPSGALVTLNANGSYSYNPNGAFDALAPGNTDTDSFNYTVSDGNGGSDTATVTITIHGVNDAPVADDESFNGANGAIGNTSLVVNDPTDGAPTLTSPKKVIAGDILDGDTDADGPGPLTVTAGNFPTNDGGFVTIEADGDFTFYPAPATSCTDTSDFFDYTVEDSGSPELTDVGRVTISIAGCVWYVNNDNLTGNSGTSLLPFDTLAQAEASSSTNHTVFVFDGDNTSTGYNTGFLMKAGQRLIGEHEGLVVDPDGGGGLGPEILYPANPGALPTLTATNEDVIGLDDGNEIRGFNLDPSGTGGGIEGGVGDTGGGTIDDVNIVDTGTAGTQPSLELNGTTGTFNVSNLAITTTASAGIAISSAGTVNFADAGTISVTAAGGPGVSITGTTTSGVIDSVTVTSSPTGGIVLDDNPGALTINDINLTTTGVGLLVDSSEDVTINGGDADITSGSTAVSLTTDGSNPANPPDVTLDQVTSTGGPLGIDIEDIGAGTFSAVGGALSGHTFAEVSIGSGSGNISYGGTIGNGNGRSVDVALRTGGAITLSGDINDTNDVGGGVAVQSGTGGSTTLSGGTKTLNTGALPGVLLASNAGHTIAFTNGGLDIDTTTGAGFSATGGGTITVETGATVNTIDTGTGTALNVANTTIGAGDMTFLRISSNGASNGILLNTTGATGNLVVTGDTSGTCGTAGTEADCSGGTIQASTGDGISLTSTAAPSFTRVNVKNNLGSGIKATGVSGLTISNSRIVNNADTAGISEAGISLTNVTGSTSIGSSTVRDSFEDNVHWNISSGTGTVGVASSTVGPTDALGNSGIQIVGTSTGVGTLNVTGSTFASNNSQGIALSLANSSALTLNVGTSTFTDNNIAVAIGVVDDADTTFDINGNTALRSETNAFQVLGGETTTTNSHLTGFIRNNTIGDTTADSGARDLDGIAVEINDDGDGVISILSNVIRHVDQNGIFVQTRDLTAGDGTANDATLDVHIRDNSIQNIDDNSIVPIGLVYGMLIDARQNTNICLDISSNTSTNIAAQDIRVRQRDASIHRLERFVGNGALDTDVEAFIAAQNDAGTTADATHVTSFTGVADGTCRDP